MPSQTHLDSLATVKPHYVTLSDKIRTMKLIVCLLWQILLSLCDLHIIKFCQNPSHHINLHLREDIFVERSQFQTAFITFGHSVGTHPERVWLSLAIHLIWRFSRDKAIQHLRTVYMKKTIWMAKVVSFVKKDEFLSCFLSVCKFGSVG